MTLEELEKMKLLLHSELTIEEILTILNERKNQ